MRFTKKLFAEYVIAHKDTYEEDLKYFENNYYFRSYCDLTIYDDSDIERIVSEKLLERYF